MAEGDPVMAAPTGNGAPAPGVLLEVDHVRAFYGKSEILSDVSVEVRAGERVALLGTNGAGKSTLLKVIAGLVDCRAGKVSFAGESLAKVDPRARVLKGMSLYTGGRGVFPSLTVHENLRMGAYTYLSDKSAVHTRMDEVCTIVPALGPLLGRKGGALSSGERQMVGIGRALMSNPRLLMIDELSLGLAPVVVSRLLPIVEGLTDAGVTIVVVEQSLHIAQRLASRCYFLEKGTVRFAGPTAELIERGDIARAVFFGRDGGQ
jgi:ABC-type branched-subunit amino acid transport system ATPase component